MLCTAHQMLFRRLNQENEMGRAHSAGGERRGVYRFLVGKPAWKS
jgi:hypothetical protein